VTVEAGPSRASDRVASLEVPRDERYVATLRAFVASVGRSWGLDVGLVEDLRLVVSELCSAPAQHVSTIGVEMRAQDGSIRLECHGVREPLGDGDGDEPMRRRLLLALAPDVRWWSDGTGDRVAFGLQLTG
jgi:hypothetical protein